MLFMLVSARAGDDKPQVTRSLHNFYAFEKAATSEILVIGFSTDMRVVLERHLTPKERERARYHDKQARKGADNDIGQILPEVSELCSTT